MAASGPVDSDLVAAYREKVAAVGAVAPERKFGDAEYLATGNPEGGGSGGTMKLALEAIFKYWEDQKLMFVGVFVFIFILFLIFYAGAEQRQRDEDLNLRALRAGSGHYRGRGGNFIAATTRGIGSN